METHNFRLADRRRFYLCYAAVCSCRRKQIALDFGIFLNVMYGMLSCKCMDVFPSRACLSFPSTLPERSERKMVVGLGDAPSNACMSGR